MGRQVPDHAHVGLVEAEVQPRRGDVLDPPEATVAHHPFDQLDARAEQKVCPTMSVRWARSARTTRSAASSAERASGFSTSTWLPASSAVQTSGWCVLTGVAITVAQMLFASRASSSDSQPTVAGYCARRRHPVDRAVDHHDVLGAGQRDQAPEEIRTPVAEPDQCDLGATRREGFLHAATRAVAPASAATTRSRSDSCIPGQKGSDRIERASCSATGNRPPPVRPRAAGWRWIGRG